MFQKALAHFKKTDPLLFELAKSIDPIARTSNPETEGHFFRLVRAIIGQQLSVKAAATIFGRFEKLFPKQKITPERLLKLDKEKIRACGVSYPKINYLKDLAEKVIQKELILEKIESLPDEEIIQSLTRVKGIGQWSAEMFLMFALNREDIFSPGDMGLQNAIKKLYGMDKVSKEELLEISLKWSPYRTYACLVLWESLDNKPK